MNPSSVVTSSLVNQAAMEELRLLEQRQQQQQQQRAFASRNLPFHIPGASLQSYLQGQGKQSNSQMGLFGANVGGSLNIASSGGGGRDPLGMNDLSQLQAAIRLREQPARRGQPHRSSLTAPSMRGITTAQENPSLQTPGSLSSRMHGTLLKLPGGATVVDSLRKRPLDNMWSLEMQQMKRLKSVSGGSTFDDIKAGNVNIKGSRFPLPPLDDQHAKRRQQNHPLLLSYKSLWLNANVSSTSVRKEVFVRRLTRGRMEILDKSGIIRSR